jgi:hypothetical protein
MKTIVASAVVNWRKCRTKGFALMEGFSLIVRNARVPCCVVIWNTKIGVLIANGMHASFQTFIQCCLHASLSLCRRVQVSFTAMKARLYLPRSLHEPLSIQQPLLQRSAFRYLIVPHLACLKMEVNCDTTLPWSSLKLVGRWRSQAFPGINFRIACSLIFYALFNVFNTYALQLMCK